MAPAPFPPPGTLLVPTDFSPTAEAALDIAVRLAASAGSGVVALHVFPHPPPDDPGRAPATTGPRQLAAFEAEEHLYALAERKSAPAVPVCPCFVPRGDVPAAILDAAEASGVGLVVLGARGWGQAPGQLGEVAAQVVRRSQRPVLVVPEGHDRPGGASAPTAPFRRVVVPFDLSVHAEAALRLARALAARYGVPLLAFHVADESLLTASGWGGEAVEAADESVGAAYEGSVGHFAALALGPGAGAEVRLATDPSAGILEELTPGDLLVLAPHGGYGLTARVLAAAPCAALLLPGHAGAGRPKAAIPDAACC